MNKRAQVVKSNLIYNCNYLIDQINQKNIILEEEDKKFITLNPFIINITNNFNAEDIEEFKTLEALDKWISYLNYKYNPDHHKQLFKFNSNAMSTYKEFGLIFK